MGQKVKKNPRTGIFLLAHCGRKGSENHPYGFPSRKDSETEGVRGALDAIPSHRCGSSGRSTKTVFYTRRSPGMPGLF